MTITSTPEAELEAQLTATLRRVFPGTLGLHVQKRFTLRLGHKEIEVGARGYIEGRADILVHRGEEALAIIELKREGLTLTADDEAQGRSYALVTRAPLVVVTNGAETRIYQTHDMAPVAGTSIEATELVHRLSTAAALAQSSVAAAIGKLLGTDLSREALTAISTTELEQATGDWASSAPFVDKFLVPREATNELRNMVREAKDRVAILSGPPLCGKSSVLRELTLSAERDGWDVLFVDGSACSEGLFRRLANILSTQFSWPATTEEARLWLRQLASRPNRRIVLCIDSLRPESEILNTEINEVISGGFGSFLTLIVAIDENSYEELATKPGRRERTRLGRNSSQLKLGNYSDEEFQLAATKLSELGGTFVHGAEFSPELRAPWVLRAAVEQQLEQIPGGARAVLPPLLGADMFDIADERFALLGDIRDTFSSFAQIYIDELNTKRQHVGDMLSSLYVFSIARHALKNRMNRDDINDLVRVGLIRSSTSYSGEAFYIVRVPALFGHEVAVRLSTLLLRKISKVPDEAAEWLVKLCSRMPLGDAIGAFALNRSLPRLGPPNYVQLINQLLSMSPTRKSLAPGTKMVGLVPSVGVIDFEIGEDGTMTMTSRDLPSSPLRIDVDESDLIATGDVDAWLILSQLRQFTVAFADPEKGLFNVAAWLLMELGSCPIVLRKPSQELEGFHVHEIEAGEISCTQNGIVEPVTWAITELLGQDVPGVDRGAWVRRAVASGSLPLINRVGQALDHLSKVAGRSEWAEQMLEQVCIPALRQHPQFH